MKKLQLRTDALRVESFATDFTGAAARGTVRAHEFLAPTNSASCVTCTRPSDPCLCFEPPMRG